MGENHPGRFVSEKEGENAYSAGCACLFLKREAKKGKRKHASSGGACGGKEGNVAKDHRFHSGGTTAHILTRREKVHFEHAVERGEKNWGFWGNGRFAKGEGPGVNISGERRWIVISLIKGYSSFRWKHVLSKREGKGEVEI